MVEDGHPLGNRRDKKSLEEKVMLVKERFQDADIRAISPHHDLVCAGMVFAFGNVNCLESINNKLRDEACKIGAIYVFGVDYRMSGDGSSGVRVIAFGDAYKPKEGPPYR